MPRPVKCRNVENFPLVTIFKPTGVGMQDLETVLLGYEELESMRLVDYESKKHEEAAQIMQVSRATFGRIVEKARYNVADALLNGKAIVIQGGEFCVSDISSQTQSILLSKFFLEKKKKCTKCLKYQKINDLESESNI